MVKYGFEWHVHVRKTLVHMYGMVKEVLVASKLFDKMLEPDMVAWNTVIEPELICFPFVEHDKHVLLFQRGLSNFCML